MARPGHASAAAAIRYQHKLEGQDAKIADDLDDVGRSALTDAIRSLTVLQIRTLVAP